MRLRLPGSRANLLSYYLDNIIYRHEIGMDTLGHLRKGSPVVVVHIVMLLVIALAVVMFMFRGWMGVMDVTGGFLLLASLSAYPLAYRRAFVSIRRERLSGTLEQLYLTLLHPQELFDGKFYGALAPFFEVRRYLGIFALNFCIATLLTFGGPMAVLAAVNCLFLINHYGYSASLGVIGGIKAGATTNNIGMAMVKDFELNPFSNHFLFTVLNVNNFKLLGFSALVFVGGYVIYDVTRSINLFLVCLYASLATLLLIPLNTSYHLSNHERGEREKLAKGFRKTLRFDSVM